MFSKRHKFQLNFASHQGTQLGSGIKSEVKAKMYLGYSDA